MLTPPRKKKVEEVSDDDLYAYFFDDVASEDTGAAIDNYVDEKMRRDTENGTFEERCKRYAAGERNDEEDLAKLSAEGDRESELP